MSKILEFYGSATRSHARTAVFLTVLSFACFLPGFFSIPPVDRDEARFAQATKQMLETGDYIDIRIQDQVRYKKPVGIYWLQAAAVHASGQGADAPIWVYRLPSLIGAIAVVLLTYWTALALVSRPAAVLAATMIAGVLLLGVEARLAKTDAVLCATIVAAMGVLARLHSRCDEELPWWQVGVFWLSGALGFLVKGPIWLMVVGLAIAAKALLDRSPGRLMQLRPLAGIAFMLTAVVPWYAAIILLSDGTFLKLSLGGDMLGKVAGGQESHGAPPGTYLGALLITSWPMIAPLLLSLGWIWRHRAGDAVGFLLCWIVPSWIVFELVATKLPHYVLPLYPALAILAAAALTAGGAARGRWWTRLLGALGFAALVYGPAIAFAVLYYLEGTVSVPGLLTWALLVPLGWMAVAGGWRERLKEAAVVASLAAPLFYFAIYETALAGMSSVQLSPRMTAAIESGSSCEPVSVMGTNFREASLVFLVGTDMQWGSADDAAGFLAASGCRAAIIDAKEEDDFLASAQRRDVAPRLIGHIDGINIANGRKTSVLIYGNSAP